MKAYMTKYALSEGIKEVDGEIDDVGNYLVIGSLGGYREYIASCDWGPTLEDAKAQAEAKRVRKIAALHKQIKRLEELSFK